ncbi:hypothetical protein [Moheibacter sediminis]|uniref:Uncharacterized protein n=1 Tax=Moheibacter sediminis TaxID=1434700 RepID=A0A1W2C2D6_9FLAO|nr:hypothetical protein [Moheibacter sediminis]SMC79395.1 hypothetical protein SAMN06296427_10885 [Moheibacter sediminis]
MTKYLSCLIVVGLISLTSCGDTKREEELIQREKAIAQKESQFAEKEADYLSLIKMRDSLKTVQDSTVYFSWPDSISGIWSSKVICTESNCNDYVIGDQRVDNWEFAQDSTGLITRVLNNKNEIVRTYAAKFSPAGIQLKFKTDSLADKQVVMNINLDNIKSDKLTGKRNISVDNKCSAVFNVELTRPNPKK